VKKWKSVKIWQNYGHEFLVTLLGRPCTITFVKQMHNVHLKLCGRYHFCDSLVKRCNESPLTFCMQSGNDCGPRSNKTIRTRMMRQMEKTQTVTVGWRYWMLVDVNNDTSHFHWRRLSAACPAGIWLCLTCRLQLNHHCLSQHPPHVDCDLRSTASDVEQKLLNTTRQ